MARHTTLFDAFLTALRVPHTRLYANKRFNTMTFKSLFGLTSLLEEYGVETEGVKLAQPSEALSFQPPFLARTRKGEIVLVEDIKNGTVTTWLNGQKTAQASAAFINRLGGIVLLAFPKPQAVEPDYKQHLRTEIILNGRNIIILAVALFLLVYGYITSGLWHNVFHSLLLVLTMAGGVLSFLLLQKTWKIKSAAADAVCGVIQKHGCDHVLESDGSKFLGVLSWSEVGMGYFSVTLAVLLLFPDMLGWLALVNVCCLPYSFWSVWYQKFRARHWCTLCLGVQSVLWLSFICYLLGGCFKLIAMPLNNLFVLGAVYVFVVFGLNILSLFIQRLQSK